MKHIIKIFFIGMLSIGGLASINAQCRTDIDPHSMSCQEDTFNGAIFPLMKVKDAFMDGLSLLDGNWKLLTVNAPKAVGNPNHDKDSQQLETKFVTGNNKRPVSVENKSDKTTTGGMQIRTLTQNNNRWMNMTIQNFSARGVTLQLNRMWFENQGSLANKTIFWQTENGKVTLKCRVFERVSNDHLLCQWFEPNFVGYLGFVR